MKTMKIFEPAMCCPTGLCGVGVDPELLRISTVLNTLKENGVEVQRYNLTSAPMEFVNHKAVADFLQKLISYFTLLFHILPFTLEDTPFLPLSKVISPHTVILLSFSQAVWPLNLLL